MCSGICLRILFALFPAYVTCLGNNEGSMPTSNVKRFSARAFPVTGTEVKQVGNWKDPEYISVHQPQSQGTNGHYGSHLKEKLFGAYGFGQPSAKYEPQRASDVFRSVQPASQLASTPSQRGYTLKTPREHGSSKHSGSKSSHNVAKSSTTGSSKIFVVQSPKDAYGHVEFKPKVSRGPNHSASVLSHTSHHHGSAPINKNARKLQTASNTYSPFLSGTPVYSNTYQRKPFTGGLQYTVAKPSVVSSGPILVVQGGEHAKDHGGYSKHPLKPVRVPSHVDPYQHASSRAGKPSRDTLPAAIQSSISWNRPPHHVKGGRYSPSPKPRKFSKNDCGTNIAETSIASSGEILWRAPESVQSNKLPSHHESNEAVQHPRRFHQTYNIHGPSQSRPPIYSSVSGNQPNHIGPMSYSQSGFQHNVVKPSIASSGEILIMQVPVNAQGKTEPHKPQVTSKLHHSFPGRKVAVGSGQTAHRYQPSDASQKASAAKPSVAGSKDVNTVHVRLNKWPMSSFGNIQNQWASGDNVVASSTYSGISQSSLPASSHLGWGAGQNAQTLVSSSVPQYHGFKGVQSQSAVTHLNADLSRHAITTIPNEFGQGVIRRLSPMLFSSYKPAQQDQGKVQKVDSAASRCEVRQMGPSGSSQQGTVSTLGVNLPSRSQRLL